MNHEIELFLSIIILFIIFIYFRYKNNKKILKEKEKRNKEIPFLLIEEEKRVIKIKIKLREAYCEVEKITNELRKKEKTINNFKREILSFKIKEDKEKLKKRSKKGFF